MLEQFMAGLLVFDSWHKWSYYTCGHAAGEQRLPKPIGVHLILAGSWSKEWGQPHQPLLHF
jgi:hypothetical protein